MSWRCIELLTNIASKHGYVIKKEASAISRIDALFERFGILICPCTFVPEKPSVESLTKCPCDTMVKQVTDNGKCHCGLFEMPSES